MSKDYLHSFVVATILVVLMVWIIIEVVRRDNEQKYIVGSQMTQDIRAVRVSK